MALISREAIVENLKKSLGESQVITDEKVLKESSATENTNKFVKYTLNLFLLQLFMLKALNKLQMF